MTLKSYKIIKLSLIIVLAVVFSQAVIFKNYLIPVVLMVVASLVLLALRRRVTEIIADERDYATGGKAALLVIQLYAWAATIAMFIFYAGRDLNPAYEPIAITLAFSTCLLMLLYAVLFRYINKIKFSNKKLIYKIFIGILFIIILIFSVRLFSGEDNWLCQNGVWQKHGQPSWPAPSVPCK